LSQASILAISAFTLAAIAVLPGTLGIVKFTRKLAATRAGSRLIYGASKWLLLLSAAMLGAAVIAAVREDLTSSIFIVAVLGYLAILVFGFLMHVALNFKPIKKPRFESIDDALAKFGPDEEVVGVIDEAGNAFAFVTRLARRPHVVYQPDGDNPFVMSHCILAHSSMSYAMRGGFRDPDILVVAVIANNMVFYDKKSQCAVIQIQNRPREGSLALDPLGTVAVKLQTWRKLYPSSVVWSRPKEWRDTFYLKLLARADVISPTSPVMIYPTERDVDQRLPLKSEVLGVKVDGAECAYPVDDVREMGIINDQLGDRPLVIVSAVSGDFLQVYNRELEPGLVLEFGAMPNDNEFTDTSTNSIWTATGQCRQGALQGRKLQALPHYNKIFWYVWADFHPDTKVYTAVPEK
jgi:hypothetical protein